MALADGLESVVRLGSFTPYLVVRIVARMISLTADPLLSSLRNKLKLRSPGKEEDWSKTGDKVGVRCDTWSCPDSQIEQVL